MKMSELKKTMELDAIESKIDELKIVIANGYTALDPYFLVETLRHMDNLKDRCYDQLGADHPRDINTVPKFQSWDTSLLIDRDRLAADKDRCFDVSRCSEDWQFTKCIAKNICNLAQKLQDEIEKFRYPTDQTSDWQENWCIKLESLAAEFAEFDRMPPSPEWFSQ